MSIPPDRAAYDLWRLESDLTNQLLSQLEATSRATLHALGCPTDPVSLFAIVNGEQPASWPKRMAARNRQRARNEMYVLALLPQIRAHLSFGAENSQRAVYYALIAMAHANNAAVNAVLAAAARQGGQKGGRKTGQRITRIAAETEKTIRRLVARWRASEELRERFRTSTAYVCDQTGLAARTVQRHLKKLGLARRSA